MEKETMVANEVASLFGKTPKTLRYDMSRHPERLPKWFKLPGSRKPLWLRETVLEFLRSHAEQHKALPGQSAVSEGK